MKTNKCAFYEEYKRQVGIGEIEKQHGYLMDIKVCLRVKSTVGYSKPHYSIYSKPMKLRFCPSCGKELNAK